MLTGVLLPNEDGSMQVTNKGRALWRLDDGEIEDMPQGEYLMVPLNAVVDFGKIAHLVRARFGLEDNSEPDTDLPEV